MAQYKVCSNSQSYCIGGGSVRKLPTVYWTFFRPCDFSFDKRIADGATSNPCVSKPAVAQARTSWPVPQPGTQTVPRGRSGCAARKSTRPGEGAPFSHGTSPV